MNHVRDFDYDRGVPYTMRRNPAPSKQRGLRFCARKGGPGQTLVLFALLLVGLLAVTGLVLDGGNLYLQRRAMQNAADAAALAGARVLALNGTAEQARSAALEYAVQRNLANSCVITVTSSSVTVTAYKTMPITFARVIGLAELTISAQATAGFSPVRATAGLAPVAVRNFDYQYGTSYTIWDDSIDADPVTGNISGSFRGWLNLNCVYPDNCASAGTSEVVPWMRDGYPGVRAINTWIRGDGGTRTPAIAEARVGQILKVAIYDQVSDLYNNTTYYHVCKFAAFEITSVKATGNPKAIQGKFRTYVTPGSAAGTEDGGLRIISLTR